MNREQDRKLGIRKQLDVITHFGVLTRRVKRNAKDRSGDLFKSVIPKWDYIYAVLDTSCYRMFRYYQEQQFYSIQNVILGKLTHNNMHTDLSSATKT